MPTNVLSYFIGISEQGNILWWQRFHGFSRNQGNSQRPCMSLLSGPSLSSQLCLHFGVAMIQFFQCLPLLPVPEDSSHVPTISLVLWPEMI